MKDKIFVKGYKVFNPDWTCSPNGNIKQYTCPGKFEEKGQLITCQHGMHFCEDIKDCFGYYDFDSDNKVAEVIAYGQVLREGDKSCTNKLEIIREISWEEVLSLVNIGKKCTGYGNVGEYNGGNHNTGSHNSGHWNTGNCNTKNFNAGGNNDGNWNTGNYNVGNFNVGNLNTGNYNVGDYNLGDCNTGDFNIGEYNVGDFNKTSFATGCFMTEKQTISMFNKPCNWTYDNWVNSDAYHILTTMPKVSGISWIRKQLMIDEEKKKYPTYKITGGYLKVKDKPESTQEWWDKLSEEEKYIIEYLPNFDKDIFKEITGITIKED